MSNISISVPEDYVDNMEQSGENFVSVTFRDIDHSIPYDYDYYDFKNINFIVKEIHIDLDYTVGDISKASTLGDIWKVLKKTREWPSYSVMKWFFEGGAIRPYFKEFLQYLKIKKDKTGIKIMIHTSNNDKEGYVSWIKYMLEQYADVPEGTIDGVIDATTAISYSRCGATIKHIDHNVLIFDDKPWNVRPFNQAIGVVPYYQHVDNAPFFKFFDKKLHNTLAQVLNDDEERYGTAGDDYKNDQVFHYILEKLDKTLN